jgi:hypothetical protein
MVDIYYFPTLPRHLLLSPMSKKEQYHLNERLHTEVLEERYGKISVQLLHDDDQMREVLLSDQQHIARTYAMTIRSKAWRNNKEVCAVNDAIRSGEPIGKAFKTRGFTIQKNILAVYPLALPDWLRDAFMVGDIFAKTRITEFYIEKSGLSYLYGHVTEVYSPDFREPAVSRYDMAQVNCPPDRLPRVMELKQRVNEMLSEIAPVLLFF